MELILGQSIFGGLAALLAVGSFFGLIKDSHWFFRGWEYPRVQIIVLCGLMLIGFLAFEWGYDSDWRWWDTALLAVTLAACSWHTIRVIRYTRLTNRQVIDDDPSLGGRAAGITVMTSNVQMENTDFDAFMQVVRDNGPDVVFALETDQKWIDGTKALQDEYRHAVTLPQDNWYGMMMLCNLDLVDHEVRYLVQDDIPSIHARVRLDRDDETGDDRTGDDRTGDGGTGNGSDGRGGRHGGGSLECVIRGLHPRPPEPIRGNDSTSRDAELVVVGREIEVADEPTIVTGDLNDVAWSHTTRLFLRISELLDPRRGRGFFTTWPVAHPFWRVPLDHIFHSADFTLKSLKRLPDIGSDHFPILAHLVLRTTADEHQLPTDTFGDDEEEAQEKIEEAEEVNERQVQSPQRTMPTESTMQRVAALVRGRRMRPA